MGEFISLLVVILFYLSVNLILYIVFEYCTGRIQRKRDDKGQEEEDLKKKTK